jgi:hypothetical protein
MAQHYPELCSIRLPLSNSSIIATHLHRGRRLEYNHPLFLEVQMLQIYHNLLMTSIKSISPSALPNVPCGEAHETGVYGRGRYMSGLCPEWDMMQMEFIRRE